jgi:hypothetical protein
MEIESVKGQSGTINLNSNYSFSGDYFHHISKINSLCLNHFMPVEISYILITTPAGGYYNLSYRS